ncbi:MAG: homoserine dehydrogenase, partial [Clostridia bacterium]|nr:homoserine dehydrogenase [Clostridia bacterium]
GAMGKGILYQTLVTPGVECVVLCDINKKMLDDCVSTLSLNAEMAGTASSIGSIVDSGKTALCTDGMLAACYDGIDVLVEASSSITAGARYVLSAIENKKHVVLMNAEIDLLFGPLFLLRAREKGVIVSSCDGDQHGVIKQLIDDIKLWGFEPIMAGNIKGFLDRSSNPEKIIPEADKRHLDYKMCTAYTDGSKLSIEMAIVANALDMHTLKPGMLGPMATNVTEVLSLFDFDAIRKTRKPVVDYILGANPGGGVFAVGYHENPYQSFMMEYYKMGKGPYYLFYRPYHLCHVESIASIVSPVINGCSLLEPTYGFRTNVFAYAKKALTCGTKLDGIGGHCCYGQIENTINGKHPGLPLGLAENVAIIRDIKEGEPIMMTDIDYPANREDFSYFEQAISASEKISKLIED